MDCSKVDLCGPHRKPLPCTSCESVAVKLREVWQQPERRARHLQALKSRELAWFDDEVRVVRELAGRASSEDIARKVNAVRASYGLKPRSRHAVHAMANANNISLDRLPTVITVHEAKDVLGVCDNTVRAWRVRGWLVGRRWMKFRVFDQDELIRFVSERPWLVDIDRMLPGPVRQMAEVANRRDPWLRSAEIAPLVPATQETIHKYIRQGLVEAHQRTGHNGAYMLRASSVFRLREILALTGRLRARWPQQRRRVAA